MKKTVKRTPFSRLSRTAERVAISKDAIQQIKKRQYQIATGVWAEALEEDKGIVNQNSLKGIRPPIKCTCCAIGAAFLSSMRLFNVAGFQNEASQYDAFNQLKRYFPINQLMLIEEAFEVGQGMSCTGSDVAIEYGKKYKDDTQRALAIFKNIVRNQGAFIP